MIASQIKENFHYAVSESPRKGIKEERLHTLDGFRVNVLQKGVERWAETANGGWGGMKRDGIKVQVLDWHQGTEIAGDIRVLKSRDFLMPWADYTSRRDAEAAERRKRAEEAAARETFRKERHEAAAEKLKNVEGLLITSDIYDGHHVFDNGKSFVMTDEGVEFLLGRISVMVYDLLREQS